MSTTKLSVTIELPGSKMMTPQECGENPANYNKRTVVVENKFYDKKTKKAFYKKEALKYSTRKCIPAHQCINMSEEAYAYMTSIMCPDWYPFGLKKWKNTPREERLKLHLERLCQSLGGKSFTYVVFGD